MEKLTIYAMASLAGERGGRCISTHYVNSTTPLLWQCAAGHRWKAVPASIRKKSWCPACARVKRGTIQEMREIAETRGGVCLSAKYENTSSKLSWRCSEGHEWNAAPLHVKRDHWCPVCARVARLTLQEFQSIAEWKSGRCVSPEYLGLAAPLRWQCSLGHQWDARPASIKSGSWCPFCARNRKLELEQMCEIARERGGKCLSATYINGRAPLLWECGQGHRWKARPARVKNGARAKGSWCLQCYNLRRVFREELNIQVMRKLGLSRGGICLSTEYAGSKTKLTWQCALKHRWEARPVSIVHGTWCPQCARNQRLALTDMREIAARRGGNCLSREYLNEKTALAWYCSAGHRWSATPDKVKRGSWCPACARLARRNKPAPSLVIVPEAIAPSASPNRSPGVKVRAVVHIPPKPNTAQKSQ